MTFNDEKKAPFAIEIYEYKMKGHLSNLNPILVEDAVVCFGVIKQARYITTRPSKTLCAFLSSISTRTYLFFLLFLCNIDMNTVWHVLTYFLLFSLDKFSLISKYIYQTILNSKILFAPLHR